MNFAFSEEQEELRRIVRQFLDDKSDEQAVRAMMATEKGFDDAVWRQMADQMGLQGLIVPEEFGGSGFSYVELIVVLEEMGRSLLCAPYFSTVVLAANSLMHSGDDAAKKQHLPGIASGDTIAALAFTEDNGRWDESGITMVAGLVRGLDHEDAARFSFLLATPIIFAAGVYKLPDLLGPNGNGIRGQVLVGSIAAAIAAYLSVRYLVHYFETRTLTPFAIYCLIAGSACIVRFGFF